MDQRSAPAGGARGGSVSLIPLPLVMPPEADPRFAEGLHCFETQQFFEAHEVWESLWHSLPKSEDAPGSDRRFVQGLIQLAVSFEHWRRGNPRGARGQWEKASLKLQACGAVRWGVSLERALVEAGAFYAARDLPAAEAAQALGAWPTPVETCWPRVLRS